jgi:hypothetical protein
MVTLPRFLPGPILALNLRTMANSSQSRRMVAIVGFHCRAVRFPEESMTFVTASGVFHCDTLVSGKRGGERDCLHDSPICWTPVFRVSHSGLHIALFRTDPTANARAIT